MRSPRPLVPALAALVALAGCEARPEPGPSRAASARAPAPPPSPAERAVLFEPAPPTGDVAPLVQAAAARARAAGRTLLVYVGATWCEPCQRFHHAAEAGATDGALSPLTMLEFDLDRDRDRLVAAGYGSRFIPLFAVPSPDGRASDRRIEGSIKGEAAVAEILPRLRELVARR